MLRKVPSVLQGPHTVAADLGDVVAEFAAGAVGSGSVVVPIVAPVVAPVVVDESFADCDTAALVSVPAASDRHN